MQPQNGPVSPSTSRERDTHNLMQSDASRGLSDDALCSLRAELFADDVPIQPAMREWTEDEARRYFELGGPQPPPPAPRNSQAAGPDMPDSTDCSLAQPPDQLVRPQTRRARPIPTERSPCCARSVGHAQVTGTRDTEHGSPCSGCACVAFRVIMNVDMKRRQSYSE